MFYIIYITLVAHYSLIPGNATQSKKYESCKPYNFDKITYYENV